MGQKGQSTGGKGTKKYGKKAASCERYRTEGRREKNKARKLRRHIKRYSQDKQAETALNRLKTA